MDVLERWFSVSIANAEPRGVFPPPPTSPFVLFHVGSCKFPPPQMENGKLRFWFCGRNNPVTEARFWIRAPLRRRCELLDQNIAFSPGATTEAKTEPSSFSGPAPAPLCPFIQLALILTKNCLLASMLTVRGSQRLRGK